MEVASESIFVIAECSEDVNFDVVVVGGNSKDVFFFLVMIVEGGLVNVGSVADFVRVSEDLGLAVAVDVENVSEDIRYVPDDS